MSITLTTSQDRYVFDPATGRLTSMRPIGAPDVELLVDESAGPAFALQYLTDNGEYRSAGPEEGAPPAVTCGEGRVTVAFHRVGGLDLDVSLVVTASSDDRFSRWSAVVRNRTGYRIVDLQFPFVVVRDPLEVAVPNGHGGSLVTGQGLAHLPSDSPRCWQFIPENGNSFHYPGHIFAQFLASTGSPHGVYLACQDADANVKLFRPVRRAGGVRLGVAHVGDWPENGERQLEYDTVVTSYVGDWYDAATIYRDWALCQPWATRIVDRADVPQWLRDSPAYITMRMQGYLDDGPAPAIEEFLPHSRALPLLDRLAADLDSSLCLVLMSWERGGPWVYPDCFPPIGGDESVAEFCSAARRRGWHVGSFCNGTRWVTRHLTCDYDGEQYFRDHHGEEGACRRRDGDLWAEVWDQGWRPSYITCMAADQTRRIAREFVGRLVGWGMESIQFFDQNCNAATFPCFSDSHGHPRVPGKWMARAMAEMIADFNAQAAAAGEESVIQSTENPCNETCLPLFQQSDARPSAPSCGQPDYIPIFPFLYHECSILHGMMSMGPDPYALEIRSAWSGALGSIPGAVLTGDGTLLNRETWNWAPWEPKVGDTVAPLEMMRSVLSIRRGAGRPYLVYGRMERPAEVMGIPLVEWEYGGVPRRVPAVAHSAWSIPSGGTAVMLANWSDRDCELVVRDGRLGDLTTATVAGGRVAEGSHVRPGEVSTAEDGLRIVVPARGCALLEGGSLEDVGYEV